MILLSFLDKHRPRTIASKSMTTNFLVVCLVLIGGSLLASLVPVGPISVKPLVLGTQGVPFPAKASLYINLAVEVLAADPMQRTLTLYWYPSIAGLDCAAADPVEFDLFMSPDTMDSSSPSWAPMPPFPPLFNINSTTTCQTLSPLSPFPTFRTVTKLLVSSPQRNLIFPKRGQSSLQDYPFDVYIAPMILWLINNSTGEMISPNITDTYGIAVNFEVSLPEASTTVFHTGITNSGSQLFLTFRVERSIATKFFVVMVAITNWLTAITFTIMCAAAMIYRPHQIYSEMFVLPVGVVFAFSTIRQNMPGAPDGFGTTLDMYSTLPFLVIMTFAGLTLILLILFRRIKEQSGSKAIKEVEGALGNDNKTKSVHENFCCMCAHALKLGAESAHHAVGDQQQDAKSSRRSTEQTEQSGSLMTSDEGTCAPTLEFDKEAVDPNSTNSKGNAECMDDGQAEDPKEVLEPKEKGLGSEEGKEHLAKIDVVGDKDDQ